MRFIKSVHTIFASLLTWVASGTDKLTDFNIGSAVRTLLESVSLQMEEFYFDMEQAIRYAIDNAIYDAFGFKKQTATKATGYVTVRFRNPTEARMLIAKGTLFSTSSMSGNPVYFEAVEDTFVPIGVTEMLVPVQCTTTGLVGNINIGEITTIGASSIYVDGVTNTTGFYGGAEEETNAQRKLRFREYIRSLQRGTREAIAYGAKTVQGVAGVWVDDNYIGFVRVYVHDAHGELTDDLKNAVITILDEYRAAGIEVEVLPIIKNVVDLDLTIIFKDDAATEVYSNKLQTLLTNYLNSFSVAKDLYMSDMIATIMEGYKDVIVNIVINKGSDTSLQNNELIVAGSVKVTGVHASDWRV